MTKTLKKSNKLTLGITVDLADDDLSAELGLQALHLLGQLVPDRGQHLAEAAPVGVEVDKDQIIFG